MKLHFHLQMYHRPTAGIKPLKCKTCATNREKSRKGENKIESANKLWKNLSTRGEKEVFFFHSVYEYARGRENVENGLPEFRSDYFMRNRK